MPVQQQKHRSAPARRPRGKHTRKYAAQVRLSGPELDAILQAAEREELALGAFLRSSALLAAAQIAHGQGRG